MVFEINGGNHKNMECFPLSPCERGRPENIATLCISAAKYYCVLVFKGNSAGETSCILDLSTCWPRVHRRRNSVILKLLLGSVSSTRRVTC